MNYALLLPTFDAGPRLRSTVEEVLQQAISVIVVVDGSRDGSDAFLDRLQDPKLTVIRHSQNQGKGAAVLSGMREARQRGVTHVVVMDSDGQHPADHLPGMIQASESNPNAMILGWPVFGKEAPWERVWWRKLGNLLVRWESSPTFIRDALFGFRIYPLLPALSILETIQTARRFDFDSELAVRLAWAGVPAVNLPIPVRYYPKAHGGVSHFHYWRDNLLLIKMHLRLIRERFKSISNNVR